MAQLYCLSYSIDRLGVTRFTQEMFQAANDAAAVTEANSRITAETDVTNEVLFLMGTEVAL